MRIFNRLKGLIPVVLSFVATSTAWGQSADIDQIRNGSATAPISPADWVNGNAGHSNAHYLEGYSIPYRVKIADLVGNASTEHILIIEYDTKDQNAHALDYITHYDNLDNPPAPGSHQRIFHHAQEVIDPTRGLAFSGAPSYFDIPAPSSAGAEVAGQPTASFNALPSKSANPNILKMAIWGGTITALEYVQQQAPDGTTGSTKTSMRIKFKSANGRTALIAWGGHIAAEGDWGKGRGATGVSGSPYHTRILSIDGKGGNQDRSLKADAVIVIPKPDCGISPARTACPETSSLAYSATGSSTGSDISYQWTLTDNGANAAIQGAGNTFNIQVVPASAAGFTAGGSFDLALVVTRAGADAPANCFSQFAGRIDRTIVTAQVIPPTIDLVAGSVVQLVADIDPSSTDPDNTHYSYQWSTSNGGGTITNATSRTASYTAVLGDANKTIEFKVVATQLNDNDQFTAECSDDALAELRVSVSPPVCGISSAQTACPETPSLTFTAEGASTGSDIHYLWEITGANTAGAAIQGGVNNAFSVSIVPSGAQFNAGGSFDLRVTVSRDGALTTAVCNANPAGTIDKTIVTAVVIPPTVDLAVGGTASLVADIDPTSTDPDNTHYSYVWTLVSGTGTLSDANQRIASYTAGLGDAGNIVRFHVVATQLNDNNPLTAECSDDADAAAPVITRQPCLLDDAPPLCQNSPFTFTGPAIPANATYHWALEALGGGPTPTQFTSADGLQSISVNAVSSFRIILFVTYPNPALNNSCSKEVNVIETPVFQHSVVPITTCNDQFFEVQVSGTKAGVVYTISQQGVVKGTQTAAVTGEILTFGGLTPGLGYHINAVATFQGVHCEFNDDCAGAAQGLAEKPAAAAPLEAAREVGIEMVSGQKATAAPNPYNDRVRFSLKSEVSGRASLQLFNLMGQKVADVYSGYIQKGQTLTKEYTVPDGKRTSLIYVFTVGEQQVSGKLINLRR